MDYIKEAENYLKHYASLRKSVSHARYMIDKLMMKSCPGEVSAVNNDITGVSAQHPVNTLQEMYELQQWQKIVTDNEHEIKHISDTLESLEDKEKLILEMWYVNKMQAIDIMNEFEYDERRSVYNLKSKALKNFAINLFGIKVFNAI